MKPTTLRTLIAILLFVHTIGQVQGIITALGLFTTEKWNPDSWLFNRLLGEKAAHTLALVLWVVCVLGFLLVSLSFVGVLLPHAWWRSLAVTFAIPSLFGLIFYWHSFAQLFNKVGALGVNLGILVGLLLLHWPTEADLGL